MSFSAKELASEASLIRPVSFKVNDEKRKVPAVAFLPGDKYIITCYDHDSLQVIEAKTGRSVGSPWQDAESSQICAFAVSPNGKSVATGSKDGKIRQWTWNGKTAKMVAKSNKHAAAANCVRWSRHDGGAHIVSGFDDGRIAVWPASVLKNPISTDETRLRHIHAIDYSHDSTQLIASGYDRSYSILRIDERAREVRLDKVVEVCSNPDQVSCATWARTADGYAIVTGSTDCKIRMRPSENPTHEWEFEGHSNLVCAVVPSPDNRILASASYDHTLRLFDLKAKQPIGQPLQHSAELSCAAFSAGGTLLATGTCDGMIYVWEISSLLSGTTEDVTNVHDKGVNVRSLLIDSAIPTRASLSREPIRASTRYGDDFWSTSKVSKPKPNNNEVASDDPVASGKTRRFSIPRYVNHVQVAAARMRQSLLSSSSNATQTQRPVIVDVPRVQESGTKRKTFRTQRQQSIPLYPAIDHQPRTRQIPVAAESTTEGPTSFLAVKSTRWTRMLLHVGCIPVVEDSD